MTSSKHLNKSKSESSGDELEEPRLVTEKDPRDWGWKRTVTMLASNVPAPIKDGPAGPEAILQVKLHNCCLSQLLGLYMEGLRPGPTALRALCYSTRMMVVMEGLV